VFWALQLANKNNRPITTLRTEQEVRKLKQEVRKILNEVCLHWNIATDDRNIANSLKGLPINQFIQ
jgi:hypothetical protein